MIKNNKKGFTLIELLVVVLIIGILSSVAAPQYTRTVEKARFAEAAELLQAVSNAEQRYMLQHDEYAQYFEDLDIEIPNKSAIKMAKKVMLLTDNFRIYLDSVNEDNLISAERLASGDAKELGANARYIVYKNVVTGELFCEDTNPKDKVNCDLFAINGIALTCDDGSVSLTGEGGCKKDEKEKIELKEPVKEKKAEEEQKKDVEEKIEIHYK